jgi:hypothetical protein
MNTAIILFVICTLLNVVLATIKSVMTIKGTKISAAVWNALSFGLYSYIVIMTANADISTLGKVVITVICNLVGVYGVKLVEEKMRKDKMWKIEMTVRNDAVDALHDVLTAQGIPNHYLTAGKHTVFNCYCETKAQTDAALAAGAQYGAKCFANETTLAP